jgi:PAS domain S-box-containing protein
MPTSNSPDLGIQGWIGLHWRFLDSLLRIYSAHAADTNSEHLAVVIDRQQLLAVAPAPSPNVFLRSGVIGQKADRPSDGKIRESARQADHRQRTQQPAGIFEDFPRVVPGHGAPHKARIPNRRQLLAKRLHPPPSRREPARMIPIHESLRRCVSRATTTLRSLRFKATVAVASFIVMISVLLSALFVLYIERMERHSAAEEAMGFARLLSRDAVPGLVKKDIRLCEKAMVGAMQADNVIFVAILDTKTELIRSVKDCPPGVTAILRQHPIVTAPPSVQCIPRKSHDGHPFLDVVSPAYKDLLAAPPPRIDAASPRAADRPIGSVRVLYSLEPMVAKAQEFRWRAAGIAFAMIVLGTLGMSLLVGSLLGPIQDLAQATERIAEGDFDVHMNPPSDDEIGVLTRSFNEMTTRLQSARERQESWSRELGTRVREKTREIEETRRHLANIVENVGASVIVSDLDGTIVSANSHTTKIFGIKPEWIVGRSLQEFTFDPDREVTSLRELLQEGGTIVYEARYPIDEHRDMDLLVTHTLLHDPDGQASGILQITKDITQLKMMERRLVDSERLSAMGEMAGEIGHELNNYLLAIGGRAELMTIAVERRNDEMILQSAQIIAEEVGRMRVLTQGLLDSSRKESSLAEIDLNETLQRSVEFARPQNKFDSIQMLVECTDEPLLVHADPQQLTQVILNLLSNSADAILAKNPEGPGTIRVESFRRGNDAGFFVEDDGIGMDERIVARIFEPRFTTKKSGNGFGLAVSHRVIQNHGGQIRVSTAPGRGATFTITLPALYPIAPPSRGIPRASRR